MTGAIAGLPAVAGFLACAGLIVYSGIRLSHYGDRIAELTGWGRAWLGLILMAAVTSLPELLTGISAVIVVKAPDLAAGDVFGSCVFNLLLLSLLDLRLKRPLSSLVRSGHVVAALFGIILLTAAGAALLAGDRLPVIGWFSSFTPVIIGIYLLAIWGIFRYEQQQPAERETVPKRDKPALRSAFRAFGLHALVVIGAAVFLPHFGEQLAQSSGMGSAFFGTTFLAASTSLPELVVSFSAIRLGSYDMAVGNLLGSNVFNILILALDDLFYVEGPLFTAVQPVHIMSVFATVAMTAVAGLGILIKPQRKMWWVFSIDSLTIVVIYVVLMFYLYHTAH